MNKLRNYFISGIIISLPIASTIYLLFLAINFTDGLLGKYLEPYFYERVGFYIPGISILVGISLIVFVGFVVTHFIGTRVYGFFENLLVKLPFFRQVYPALKEMVLFLFSRDRMSSFKQVVLVQYPSKGIYSMGFLTNDSIDEIREKTKKELCNIFISTSPSPLTGFTIMVPKKDLIYLDISVESAFKFVVSGGVVNPRR